ncbi:MAG TPA: Rid family detoxifying hydrolase [Petrotogaceae bacterium]|jgi:2-iminobutanoate/2-iminopropanoate deaminase|nr:Rid family detoxifying hydrolase [Petrotogaceae bacterium]HQC39845.1 Rid family detoxifying hydrolase [Petrotogaceae bacterium]
MKKTVINPACAPSPIGPYSVANGFENLLFVSGQLPVDIKTGQLISGDIKKATETILSNIKNILEESGSSLENVLKVTVFLKDISKFSEMNDVYAQFFKTNPPARSAFQVGALPKNADIEIEVIAHK